MKEGKLVLHFEAGRIVSVSVGSGLYESFSRRFAGAESELREDEPHIDAAVGVVVFGCMWIEALCNDFVPALLRRSSLPASVSAAVWNGLERTSILQKLKVLAGFECDEGAHDDWLAPVVGLLQLRNNLVHFKDKHVEVAGPLTPEEFEARFTAFPEAELNTKLKDTSIQNAATVRATVLRMERIFQQHVPTETVRLEEEDGAADGS